MRIRLLVLLLILSATAFAYWPVMWHRFVILDDVQYIIQNRQVTAGLTQNGFIWAFSSFYACNWHPLTWISHMADVSLFGLNPGAHHGVNLLFHLANTTLLFWALSRMTRTWQASAVVAALFALHPLHVESVAWVAERKDLLSAFFWMLTMIMYSAYARKPGLVRYLLVLILFAFGLMSKPMLVTLPLVLLLLDYWPLGRWNPVDKGSLRRLAVLVMEKAPLLLMSAVSSLVTILAQKSGGAINSLEALPITVRLGNTLAAYFKYIGLAFWPSSLAVYYPHPGQTPLGILLAAGGLLTAVTFLAVRFARERPYLPVGWFWFLGTLVPVIGIVQVGAQAMADRYTYIPLIGLFIMIVWGAADLAARFLVRPGLTVAAAVAVLLSLTLATRIQVGYWANSLTLLARTVLVTEENAAAHRFMGDALMEVNRPADAVVQYRETLRLAPCFGGAHNNLGNALKALGRSDEAAEAWRTAIRLAPDDAKPHYNLGRLLVRSGRLDEGIAHLKKAVELDPEFTKARNNLEKALAIRDGPD